MLSGYAQNCEYPRIYRCNICSAFTCDVTCVYLPMYIITAATFKPLAGETKEDSNRRYKAYTNTWGHIKQCIDVSTYSLAIYNHYNKVC